MINILNTKQGGSLFEVKADVDSDQVMVVFPGGGYVDLADYEGEPVADRFAQLGYSTYVMRYSVASNGRNRTDELLEDVHEAVAYLKKKHSSAKIVLAGFSAGGNLIANYGNRFNDVDALVLCYAVVDWRDLSERLSFETGNEEINQKARRLRDGGYLSLFGTTEVTEDMLNSISPIVSISEKTVPTFIWQSQSDLLVSADITMEYYRLLVKHHVPAELHLYKDGQHGIGLGQGMEASTWVMLADCFIKSLFRSA